MGGVDCCQWQCLKEEIYVQPECLTKDVEDTVLEFEANGG